LQQKNSGFQADTTVDNISVSPGYGWTRNSDNWIIKLIPGLPCSPGR